jgi:serine/threonine protein kinase
LRRASQNKDVDEIRSKSGRDLKHLEQEVREKYNQSGLCEDFYDIGKVIGKGGFATVRHGALCRTRGVLYGMHGIGVGMTSAVTVSCHQPHAVAFKNAPGRQAARHASDPDSCAGTDKNTQEQFAIKIMEVAPPGQDVGGNDNTWADVIAEVSILCHLNHPNIISLREFFIQQNKVYLVTDLVKGAFSCACLSRHVQS